MVDSVIVAAPSRRPARNLSQQPVERDQPLRHRPSPVPNRAPHFVCHFDRVCARAAGLIVNDSHAERTRSNCTGRLDSALPKAHTQVDRDASAKPPGRFQPPSFSDYWHPMTASPLAPTLCVGEGSPMSTQSSLRPFVPAASLREAPEVTQVASPIMDGVRRGMPTQTLP